MPNKNSRNRPGSGVRNRSQNSSNSSTPAATSSGSNSKAPTSTGNPNRRGQGDTGGVKARNEEKEDTITLGTTSFGKTNTSDTSALRYPKHQDITASSDYVAFEFYKYAPPFSQDRSGTQRQDYSASASDDALGEKLESILMYMPEDIQSEYGANWGGAGFGLIAKNMMQGASALTGNGGSFDLGSVLQDTLGAAKRKLVDLAVDNANKALGTSVTQNQAIGGIEGKVVNPNVEMMYEAPEMRGFSLNFKMFASNEIESNEIRAIVNTFKKNMLPTFGGQYIQVPNIVKVTFMTGPSPNQFVSQYKPCAITNVSVNYTPDGTWAAYREGRPVATQLTIQFKELKMLFQDDITVNGATY